MLIVTDDSFKIINLHFFLSSHVCLKFYQQHALRLHVSIIKLSLLRWSKNVTKTICVQSYTQPLLPALLSRQLFQRLETCCQLE